MDILVSSNLERLLYLLSGDTALVAKLMEQLNTQGFYKVEGKLLEQVQEAFWADFCDDAGADKAMGQVWREHRYLCDPHTAAGWVVAENYVNQTGDTRPMVVLSTASPYKFPAAVLAAIGGDVSGDEFAQQGALEALTAVPMPRNLQGLKEKAALHTGVIEKETMLSFVQALHF